MSFVPARCKRTVELDPSFAAAHLVLGEAYVQAGRSDRGLAELQSAAGLSGNNPLYLAQVGVAYASAGRKTERHVGGTDCTCERKFGVGWELALGSCADFGR